jgi:hypothetical protein
MKSLRRVDLTDDWRGRRTVRNFFRWKPEAVLIVSAQIPLFLIGIAAVCTGRISARGLHLTGLAARVAGTLTVTAACYGMYLIWRSWRKYRTER